MHIKRFHAVTSQEALAQVKRELGSEALVLSMRKVRRDGGVFGLFGRPVVEVVAAVDREHRAPRSASSERPAEVRPDPSWRALSLNKALLDPLANELEQLRRTVDGLRGSQQSQESLRAELHSLRGMVSELASSGRSHPVETSLQSCGLDASQAAKLCDLASERARECGGEPSDFVRALLEEKLEERLRTPRPDDRDRVCVLVGAAGVGKTTSVAKLAARLGGDGERSAILTTDTWRTGSDLQLRGYAQQIGVPFVPAVGEEDLTRQLSRLGTRRILVDTAGRSGRDANAIPDLERLCASLGGRAQVHLVVAATTKESDARAQIERHRPLDPQALVVTHTDESESFGSVANLLLDPDTPPLAWIANGQNVPDDLQLPEAGRLVDGVLGADA